MSQILVTGTGAVCSAGWTSESFFEAVCKSLPLPTSTLTSGETGKSFQVRQMAAAPPLDFLRHPRLRRSSSISQYAVASALEAFGNTSTATQERVGVIFCAWGGCVNYSRRFFSEALQDAATASPLLFPETVFNAPASHLSTILQRQVESYTIVGDSSCFLQGMAIATQWLLEGRVERCLVVGSEEIDWVIADAFCTFHQSIPFTAGAGALCLSTAANSEGVFLDRITDAHPIHDWASRKKAATEMRAQLRLTTGSTILVDGQVGNELLDDAEKTAFGNELPRISPKKTLGEGFISSAALQCVAAVLAVRKQLAATAAVSIVGYNQAATGAVFSQKGAS